MQEILDKNSGFNRHIPEIVCIILKLDLIAPRLASEFLSLSKKEVSEEIDIVESVVIKDRCHISAGVIILPGSILEEDVFVCAGAVVSGTTKPGGLYVGNPARFVGYKKDYKK